MLTFDQFRDVIFMNGSIGVGEATLLLVKKTVAVSYKVLLSRFCGEAMWQKFLLVPRSYY